MIKTLLIGTALLGAAGAQATAVIPTPVNLVVNGSFETVASGVTGKTSFANNVPGWTGGSNLTFIDYPGTADDGSYLSVYKGFPATSPDGGKFVEADGDPSYSSAISQTISGLTIGNKYVLSFYQGGGQQVGFTGPTTERWQVTFGTDTRLSTLFSLPQGATAPWLGQSMTFTATAASQTLSFLAVGTPNGAPPISFLDGVSLTAVPEPATWALLLAGFGMVGVAARRRRPVAVTA